VGSIGTPVEAHLERYSSMRDDSVSRRVENFFRRSVVNKEVHASRRERFQRSPSAPAIPNPPSTLSTFSKIPLQVRSAQQRSGITQQRRGGQGVHEGVSNLVVEDCQSTGGLCTLLQEVFVNHFSIHKYSGEKRSKPSPDDGTACLHLLMQIFISWILSVSICCSN
jgi:hypothetical protein